ncbi:MAG TPA: hypothetical protein VK324_03350, partial [Tepidisphaeraceae bacterium]|nr:hypothetical protein [Tepidisphaeraceae bacterium]
VAGRFVSQDPLGFGGGDANLYRYVGNRTPNGTDPTGTSWLSEAFDDVEDEVKNFGRQLGRALTKASNWMSEHSGLESFNLPLELFSIGWGPNSFSFGIGPGVAGLDWRVTRGPGGKIDVDGGFHLGLPLGPVGLGVSFMGGDWSGGVGLNLGKGVGVSLGFSEGGGFSAGVNYTQTSGAFRGLSAGLDVGFGRGKPSYGLSAGYRQVVDGKDADGNAAPVVTNNGGMATFTRRDGRWSTSGWAGYDLAGGRGLSYDARGNPRFADDVFGWYARASTVGQALGAAVAGTFNGGDYRGHQAMAAQPTPSELVRGMTPEQRAALAKDVWDGAHGVGTAAADAWAWLTGQAVPTSTDARGSNALTDWLGRPLQFAGPGGTVGSRPAHWHHEMQRIVWDPADANSLLNQLGLKLEPGLDPHAAEFGLIVPEDVHAKLHARKNAPIYKATRLPLDWRTQQTMFLAQAAKDLALEGSNVVTRPMVEKHLADMRARFGLVLDGRKFNAVRAAEAWPGVKDYYHELWKDGRLLAGQVTVREALPKLSAKVAYTFGRAAGMAKPIVKPLKYVVPLGAGLTYAEARARGANATQAFAVAVVDAGSPVSPLDVQDMVQREVFDTLNAIRNTHGQRTTEIQGRGNNLRQLGIPQDEFEFDFDK